MRIGVVGLWHLGEVVSSCLAELGHTVTVEVNGKQKTYQILGSSETDPARGIISHNSPLGAALLGKRVGERVRVPLNNKTVAYTIVNII